LYIIDWNSLLFQSEDEREGPRDSERLSGAHGTLLEIPATEKTEAQAADESEHDVNESNEANDLVILLQLNFQS